MARERRLTTTARALAACAVAAFLLGACSNLKEDLPAPTSGQTEVHTEGWGQPASAEFHGRYLKAESPKWDDSDCWKCHGRDYRGGTSGVSCFACHAAYPHAAAFPQGLHTNYLAANSYPLAQCQSCHGAGYTGGTITDVSCQTSGCHTDNTGAGKSPEACNSCHGQFRAPAADALSAAPPKSVAGSSDSTVAGVGAHQAHLRYASAGVTVKCKECHAVPQLWNSPGHIDASPAEVVFNDTLARQPSGRNGAYVPTGLAYAAASRQCSNTYCHGNWRADSLTAPANARFAYVASVMAGANASPRWTAGAAAAACGTCHGIPPLGHLNTGDARTCGACHTGIVSPAGAIIDESRHINGKINVFGTERRF